MKKKSSRKRTSRAHLIFNLSLFTFVFVAIGFALRYHPSAKILCANTISCEKSTHLEVDNNIEGTFNGQKVTVPPIYLDPTFQPHVLGVDTGTGEKHIYVDLSTQTLTAMQGNDTFMKVKISSGKWYPTPTGDFTIWEKVRSTRMTGGSGDDYYDLPNVPYVMFFSNDVVPRSAGFSFHGAYWHNNFGHAMSHGCINMRTTDAQKLYDWVLPTTVDYTTLSTPDNQGTKVTISGEPPA